MHKKTLLVLLGLMVAFNLVACSGKKNSENADSSAASVAIEDDSTSVIEDDFEVGSARQQELEEEMELDEQELENPEDDIEEEEAEEEEIPVENDPNIITMNETAYVQSPVNVRDAASTDASNVIGSLQAGESVQVTGRYPNGWTRIYYNGQSCYVYGSFLSTGTGKEDGTSTGSTSSGLSVPDEVEAVPSN